MIQSLHFKQRVESAWLRRFLSCARSTALYTTTQVWSGVSTARKGLTLHRDKRKIGCGHFTLHVIEAFVFQINTNTCSTPRLAVCSEFSHAGRLPVVLPGAPVAEVRGHAEEGGGVGEVPAGGRGGETRHRRSAGEKSKGENMSTADSSLTTLPCMETSKERQSAEMSQQMRQARAATACHSTFSHTRLFILPGCLVSAGSPSTPSTPP